MSFTLMNLTPPAMVVGGVAALALGYTTLGWLLIGIPVGLGVLATAWYTFTPERDEHPPPPPPDSQQ